MPLRAPAVVLLLGVLVARSAAGALPEPPAPKDPPKDPLTVYVMTFGPGDHPFFRFGHDAIWIRDREEGTDRVYNFGTFRFDSPRLIFDFLGGRLTYWLSVSSVRPVMAEYERENRSIAVQELRLSPAAKRTLQARLEDNARPDKRAYKYDYFLDNCATRVRDAIDGVDSFELHDSSRGPGRMTLREHALRMTAEPLWFYLALDLVLGPRVDRPIDRWTEMFLPEELARGLGPLAASEQVLFRAHRAPPAESPPSRGVTFLLVGLALGLALLALGWAAPHLPMLRVLFGLAVAGWGFVVGFIGCFLVYVWMFTDHVVAHRNQNILLCAPWAIALSILGFGVAAGRPGAKRKAFVVSALALAAAAVAWLLKLGIGAHQDNGVLIAFFLPVWVGLTVALFHARPAGEWTRS